MKEVHSYEDDVINWLSTTSPIEKKRQLSEMWARGNHRHNMKVLLEGKGHFYVRRCPTDLQNANPKDYLPCHLCFSWFSQAQLYRHKCPKADDKCKPSLPKSRAVLLRTTSEGLSQDMAEVLAGLVNDQVGEVAKSDKLLLDMLRFELQSGKVTDKRWRNQMRSKLRYGARLLVELRRVCPGCSLAEVLTAQNFESIVGAAKACAILEPGYESGGTSRHIGAVIRDCIGRACERALLDNDLDKYDDLVKLSGVMNVEWKDLVAVKRGNASLKDLGSAETDDLPTTTDIMQFSSGLSHALTRAINSFEENMSQRTYRELQEVTAVKIVQFNRKRGSEVTNLTVTDYTSSLCSGDTIQDEAFSSLTEEQKAIAGNHCLLVKKGGDNLNYYVILDSEMKKALDLLVQHRAVGKIFEENPFLFPIPCTPDSSLRYSAIYKKFSSSTSMSSRQMRAYLTATLKVIVFLLFKNSGNYVPYGGTAGN